MSQRFVLISGCSGGGKSTLLEELRRRGQHVVEEPGRHIVARELASNGCALPWVDAVAFAREALAVALSDLAAARALPGWVFFDRGVIDAASALQDLTGEPALSDFGASHQYYRRIFMAPPWPAVFRMDPERRHGFDAGLTEYRRLTRDFAHLGYETVLVPRAPVATRADFVLAALTDTKTG